MTSHNRTADFSFVPPVPVLKYDTAGGYPRRVLSDEENTSYSQQRTNDHELRTFNEHHQRHHTPYERNYIPQQNNPFEQQAFIPDPFRDPKSHRAHHHPQQHHYQAEHTPPTLFNRITSFPIFTYLVTLADIVMFIVELVKMAQFTGSPIQTRPYFNPMIGPSTYVQIYIGARFLPCMKYIEDITDANMFWPCPNSTTAESQVCSLAELCNFSPSVTTPNQTWRILSAMFLHAGFLHILFNLLLQFTMGREVELRIGTLKYVVIYMLAGVSGNLFGLNFAGNGVASSGASGALFGVIAVNLILFILFQDKRRIRYYKTLLVFLIGEIVVMLVLGLLPGLDNFAHIGGFISGLLSGIVLLNNPNFTKKHPSRRSKSLFSMDNLKTKQFWIWTCVRIVALCLLVAWFIGLAMNFTKNGGSNCSWCKYLSCLPVNDWCENSDLTTTTTTVPN